MSRWLSGGSKVTIPSNVTVVLEAALKLLGETVTSKDMKRAVAEAERWVSNPTFEVTVDAMPEPLTIAGSGTKFRTAKSRYTADDDFYGELSRDPPAGHKKVIIVSAIFKARLIDTYEGMRVSDRTGKVLHTEFSDDPEMDLKQARYWAWTRDYGWKTATTVDEFMELLRDSRGDITF